MMGVLYQSTRRSWDRWVIGCLWMEKQSIPANHGLIRMTPSLLKYGGSLFYKYIFNIISICITAVPNIVINLLLNLLYDKHTYIIVHLTLLLYHSISNWFKLPIFPILPKFVSGIHPRNPRLVRWQCTLWYWTGQLMDRWSLEHLTPPRLQQSPCWVYHNNHSSGANSLQVAWSSPCPSSLLPRCHVNGHGHWRLLTWCENIYLIPHFNINISMINYLF